MTIELVRESERAGICVQDMKDGQIGEVVAWDSHSPEVVGRIYQRYRGYLVAIGGRSGVGFDTLVESEIRYENCRVRLLEPGETIRIVEN